MTIFNTHVSSALPTAQGQQRYWNGRGKEYRRQKEYGIKPDEYQKMFIAQNGLCAICEDPLKTPHTDHDHKTNVVRGLLCGQCNHLLGNARDNISILQNAIRYLRDNNE